MLSSCWSVFASLIYRAPVGDSKMGRGRAFFLPNVLLLTIVSRVWRNSALCRVGAQKTFNKWMCEKGRVRKRLQTLGADPLETLLVLTVVFEVDGTGGMLSLISPKNVKLHYFLIKAQVLFYWTSHSRAMMNWKSQSQYLQLLYFPTSWVWTCLVTCFDQ